MSQFSPLLFKFLTSFLILILFPISAFTATDTYIDVAEHATFYPRKLQLFLGQDQFAGFDLKSFLQSAQRVAVIGQNDVEFKADDRTGAVNFPHHKIVVLNAQNLFGSYESEFRLLALHEFLGATGYPDQNYNISSTIKAAAVFLSQFELQSEQMKAHARSPIWSALMKQETAASTPAPILIAGEEGGGTVTGVGGGGDLRPLVAKAKVFTLYVILWFDRAKNQDISDTQIRHLQNLQFTKAQLDANANDPKYLARIAKSIFDGKYQP